MREPIKESVKALGHTPQYQMHKYFARRPYNVFSHLIKHYTDENDLILDCFCGGGVTVFEGLALDRKVIGVDLNPLATFITEMQIQQVDVKELKRLFSTFLLECRTDFADYYQYIIDGHQAEQEWMEWVYEVRCSECNSVIRLTESNKVSNGKYKCSNPECKSNLTDKPGVTRTKCEPFRSVPIRIKYHTDSGDFVHVYSDDETVVIEIR